MKNFPALLLMLVLVSCAGSQSWNRALEGSGDLAIEPAKEYGADYRVRFRDVVDFDYDGDSREDRIKVLNSYSAAQCPSGYEIRHEDTIKTGKWLTGSSSEYYYIYIKCR